MVPQCFDSSAIALSPAGARSSNQSAVPVFIPDARSGRENVVDYFNVASKGVFQVLPVCFRFVFWRFFVFNKMLSFVFRVVFALFFAPSL